jgi:hypothetical protein
VEYIIILTGLIYYGNGRIAKIHINRGYFILFDENGKELYIVRRIGGTAAIVSGFIPYLSFGTVLRLVVPENKLYAASDEEGLLEIECEVNIPA